MSGFSSQWWADVIALHPYSSVIWDFIRGRTCVCVHVMNARTVRIWRRMKLCVYVGGGGGGGVCVCARYTRGRVCFIEWLSIESWALSSVLKMGRRDLNAHLRNVIFLLLTLCSLPLYVRCWNGDSYAFACCFSHFYHHILYMLR